MNAVLAVVDLSNKRSLGGRGRHCRVGPVSRCCLSHCDSVSARVPAQEVDVTIAPGDRGGVAGDPALGVISPWRRIGRGGRCERRAASRFDYALRASPRQKTYTTSWDINAASPRPT
jgi:hypothetical protein